MLEIKDLSYTYPNETDALKNINIKIPKMNIFAILGESGSGKTTLLKCLGHFLKPQKGSILIHGKSIDTLNEIELRRFIGIVFQQLYLFPHLTVLENLTLAPVKVLKHEKQNAEKEALSILDRFGLMDLKESYPSQISGGQAQRVAIARSIILKPDYLLLDEPTSALDINTTQEFSEWLQHLKEETTFVIVTHDTLFAQETITNGVLLEKGLVIKEGAINKIIDQFVLKNK